MRKLTEQQIETIKEQIDDSISIGAMNLKVGIVLKEALNEALTIPAVVGQSEQLLCECCEDNVVEEPGDWCNDCLENPSRVITK